MTLFFTVVVSRTPRTRKSGIVESLGPEPISITDALGIEQNALAHATVISRLPAGPVELGPIVPQKRKLDEDNGCSNCSPAPAPGLEHLLSSSPYADRLAIRSYVELSDEICGLPNRDWQFWPHLRYASAVILAGCLLVKKNGEAVIANTVEVYGRQKTVDIHREPFVVQKGHPVTTSLPPPIKTRYEKVWPVTLPTIDGKRLVIGTNSFDALITSSLRLDTRMDPSIGASTPSFSLNDSAQSLDTKIFLDKQQLELGLKIAKDKDAWSVSDSDLDILPVSRIKFFYRQSHLQAIYYIQFGVVRSGSQWQRCCNVPTLSQNCLQCYTEWYRCYSQENDSESSSTSVQR
jgi:hypothetical protein